MLRLWKCLACRTRAALRGIYASDIRVTLILTFQCYSRSNMMVQLDSPYMVKPRQLCWAGFIAMLMCVCVSVCLSVCLSVNKISQKLFNQSTSFWGEAFSLTQG